jgi:putative protease
MVTRLLADDDGREITVAPGAGHVVRLPLDAALEGALLARYV